jgi:glycosyltransferase involved in cell wall biosynthesis
MGLPMVVSEGPDVAQTLHDNNAAIQVGRNESYTQVVQALVTDPDQRQTLSKNAKALAESWTWEDRVDQLAAFYEGRDL